jgi:catechol 2,3-dioxygenase-like lactoylglutathione lyase family enzyme
MRTKALVPVFHVADVAAAVDYYVNSLGFTLSFRYGTYAGLTLGDCELHLTDPGEPRHVVGAGTAYMLCDEVDEYYSSLTAAGVRLKGKPTDRSYGMRDFAIFDLDGNQITFGCDIEGD